MLVVVSETVGPFDDVISARVFGLPDSEMYVGAGQHSKDKATKKIHNFGVGNSAYSRNLLSKAVRTKESRQLMFRMLPLHCPHSHCLAGEYHIQ